MTLINIIVILILVGLALWLVNTSIPMAASIKLRWPSDGHGGCVHVVEDILAHSLGLGPAITRGNPPR